MMETFLTLSGAGLALRALSGLVVGCLLGFAHFGMLWWNARFFADGSLPRALALQFVRFALLVAVLYGMSRLGALPLLATALGILVARGLVLRRVRSLP